jgi:calcineurin-like phosphoesterase family protein
MKTYIITDTHFNHKNIIDYCNRPQNFEEIVWKGLEELPKDCLLIHLGDVCRSEERRVGKEC